MVRAEKRGGAGISTYKYQLCVWLVHPEEPQGRGKLGCPLGYFLSCSTAPCPSLALIQSRTALPLHYDQSVPNKDRQTERGRERLMVSRMKHHCLATEFLDL